jgi:hypothetical protein
MMTTATSIGHPGIGVLRTLRLVVATLGSENGELR